MQFNVGGEHEGCANSAEGITLLVDMVPLGLLDAAVSEYQ
jgi:hypothetical protein